ncbi:MAG TPA: redoxin domain-containing protein [Abditibacteriaceae bacterium]|jgi:peroxiredoxin Q/BCP
MTQRLSLLITSLVASALFACSLNARAEVSLGAPAPDFALPDQNEKVHKLADYKGKTVVLAFYPADMTPGCTLEARSLNQALSDFGKRGVQVFGVSVQDVASKKKFCELEGLTYPLLADVAKQTAKDYGVLGDNGRARRVTFLIGPDGKVAAIDRKVNTRDHARDVMAWVDALKAEKAELDKPVAPFSLFTLDGQPTILGDWAEGDTKATVIVFHSANCPVVGSYNARLNELAATYGPKGVRVLAFNANTAESVEQITTNAKDKELKFPIYRDTGAAATRLNAKVTPTAYLIDSSGLLRYQGRIDDNRFNAEAAKRDLQNALDAVLENKPVETRETVAQGCGIRKKLGPPKSDDE